MLNGLVFETFGTFQSYEVRGDVPEILAQVPVNGWSDWSFEWSSAQSGPLTVLIDGQEFAGSGTWDPIECGNFSVSFNGIYGDANGVRHAFTTTGDFLWFDQSLEGLVFWNENWQTEYDSGKVSGESQLRGKVRL